jgi:hypothetical protein
MSVSSLQTTTATSLFLSEDVQMTLLCGAVLGHEDDHSAVIVNAADTRLSGGGGVDKIVHRAVNAANAGGESSRFLKQQLNKLFPNGIKTTECCYSDGYGVFAGIIHSAGPNFGPKGGNVFPASIESLASCDSRGRMNSGSVNCEMATELLSITYRNIFLTAVQHDAKVLNLLPISSGDFRGGFTVDIFGAITSVALIRGYTYACSVDPRVISHHFDRLTMYSYDVTFHNALKTTFPMPRQEIETMLQQIAPQK